VTVSELLLRALAPVVPPACFACGASAAGAGPLCPACRGGLAWLGGEPIVLDGLSLEAWAPLAYRGGARALGRTPAAWRPW